MDRDKLRISQIFGPTIQGEGTAAGRHCVFVRTYGCNLTCSWCDTAYTWADTPEKAAKTVSGVLYNRHDPHLGEKEMTPQEVLNALRDVWDVDGNPTIVVFSGGEPLMQQSGLADLANVLTYYGNEIHVETAGTIVPDLNFNNYVTQYNVSPKLASSGNDQRRCKVNALSYFANESKARFKFVLTAKSWKEDFKEAEQLVEDFGIYRPRVMFMPEGSTPEDNIATARLFADHVIERGYGVSFRSHVLLWKDDVDK